jgi:putative beta-lysine N-acetyltransferase
MKFDTIERMGDSVVHHGTLNDRVYLTELHQDDMEDVLDRVEDLAQQRKYGKIVSRVPQWALNTFLDRGYRVEAEIPGLYRGITAGFFVAGYPSKTRIQQAEKEERFINSVKTIAMATSDASPKISAEGYLVRLLQRSEMGELAALNQRVFSSYPYPIFERNYLEECQADDYEFFGLYRDGHLVEAAILHLKEGDAYAEIIDFVIPLECKGQNLSYHLLKAIRDFIASKGIKTIFSSIRATSYGLNITFRKQGYRYGGTLINNTRVGNSMQSMNIWYLHLP